MSPHSKRTVFLYYDMKPKSKISKYIHIINLCIESMKSIHKCLKTRSGEIVFILTICSKSIQLAIFHCTHFNYVVINPFIGKKSLNQNEYHTYLFQSQNISFIFIKKLIYSGRIFLLYKIPLFYVFIQICSFIFSHFHYMHTNHSTLKVEGHLFTFRFCFLQESYIFNIQ